MTNIIVTKPSSQIKSEARGFLKDNWKIAVVVALIYLIILNAPTYTIGKIFSEGTSGILTLAYSIVIGGPLTLGLVFFVMKLARDQKVEINDLFDGFNNFGSAAILNLLIAVYTILWSLLFIIPGIIAILRYSQAYFILNDNPDMSPGEAINQSKQMMRGNKGKMFILGLSFIGWIIVTALTFGIGSLFLTPYLYVSLAVFYKEVSGEDELLKEQSVEDQQNQTNASNHEDEKI